MRVLSLFLLIPLSAGCALLSSGPRKAEPKSGPEVVLVYTSSASPASTATASGGAQASLRGVTSSVASADDDADVDKPPSDDDDGVAEEAESRDAAGNVPDAIRYTADLSDEE